MNTEIYNTDLYSELEGLADYLADKSGDGQLEPWPDLETEQWANRCAAWLRAQIAINEIALKSHRINSETNQTNQRKATQ